MLECGEDELAGRLDAPDHLDHDVEVAPGHEREGVGREEVGREVEVAVAPEPPDGDADELDRRTDPPGQLVTVAGQQACDLGADDAAAQQGDLEGSDGGGCGSHADSLSAPHRAPGRSGSP